MNNNPKLNVNTSFLEKPKSNGSQYNPSNENILIDDLSISSELRDEIKNNQIYNLQSTQNLSTNSPPLFNFQYEKQNNSENSHNIITYNKMENQGNHQIHRKYENENNDQNTTRGNNNIKKRPKRGHRANPYQDILSNFCEIDLFEFVKKGAVMWKYGKVGSPHFLIFEIDPSSTYIQWFSRNKHPGKTRISLSAFKDIKKGGNEKFLKHCNERLLKRSISLSLEENINSFDSNKRVQNNGDGIYFLNRETINNNNIKNPPKPKTTFNKKNQEDTIKGVLRTGVSNSLDLLSVNVIVFSIWTEFFDIMISFNKRMKEITNSFLSQKRKNSSKIHFEGKNSEEMKILNSNFLNGGFIRKIKNFKAKVNLPYELASRAYLLYFFEFYAAFFYMEKVSSKPSKFSKLKIQNNKPYNKNNRDINIHLGNTKPEVLGPMERKSSSLFDDEFNKAADLNVKNLNMTVSTLKNTTESDEMETQMKQIERTIKKCRKKMDNLLSIDPENKRKIMERLEMIAFDFEEIKKASLRMNFYRVRKVYWLMYVELIALNEKIISFQLENKEKRKFRFF